MKFGGVDDPGLIDFTLPVDHHDTERVLKEEGGTPLSEVYVGCAKWNKQDLKAFYPRGTKDELGYYAQQFNCIELNATFYNYSTPQIEVWREKVPDNFKFFPKVSNVISHYKRLKEVETQIEDFCNSVRCFNEKLGMCFLQLHDNFGPKNKERLEVFMEQWHDDIPLAVELRNTNWFNDASEAEWIYQLLERHNMANIITDTAGRRDLLHMRLTSPVAFVRYVGANDASDYTRLEDWTERISEWKKLGLQKLYFFVHQNLEKESPYLSAHFIDLINPVLGTSLSKPTLLVQDNPQMGIGF